MRNILLKAIGLCCIFNLLLLELKAQTAVYVCVKNGAWAASANEANGAQRSMEQLKDEALSGCIQNGGVDCQYHYSSPDPGWYAFIKGGDINGFTYLVAWSNISAYDAEQRARNGYKQKNGIDPGGATVTTWQATSKKSSSTYSPSSTYQAPKPDNGYPEYLQGVSAHREKRFYSAMDWYKEAAAQGSDSAMFNLGNMYYKGEGTTKNYSTALEWYKKAAAKGMKEALYSVGMIYYNGDGVTKDDTEARKWFKQAADKGHPESSVALKLLDAPADNGQDDFNRGVSAYQAQKYSEALDWLKKAANKGIAEAMFNLGIMYFQGQGTEKQESTALFWYQKAAEKGHPAANYNVGYMYEKGLGATADKNKALQWYKQAKEKGYPKAQEGIDRLTSEDDDDYFGW